MTNPLFDTTSKNLVKHAPLLYACLNMVKTPSQSNREEYKVKVSDLIDVLRFEGHLRLSTVQHLLLTWFYARPEGVTCERVSQGLVSRYGAVDFNGWVSLIYITKAALTGGLTAYPYGEPPSVNGQVQGGRVG